MGQIVSDGVDSTAWVKLVLARQVMHRELGHFLIRDETLVIVADEGVRRSVSVVESTISQRFESRRL